MIFDLTSPLLQNVQHTTNKEIHLKIKDTDRLFIARAIDPTCLSIANFARKELYHVCSDTSTPSVYGSSTMARSSHPRKLFARWADSYKSESPKQGSALERHCPVRSHGHTCKWTFFCCSFVARLSAFHPFVFV